MAQGGECCAYVRAVAIVAAVAVVALLIWLVIQYAHPTPPLYYGTILSVSGLGVGDGDLGQQPLQFYLNLGVQSRSPMWRRPCIGQGTAVEVSYGDVVLVSGNIGSGEICAVPGQLWTVCSLMFTMTRSNVSGLPELVGVPAFDVTFWIPSSTGRDGDEGKVVSCMARLVGDNSLAKANACDVRYTK